MDPVKRAASRLRRLQVALAPLDYAGQQAYFAQPFRVRPLTTGGPGLRHTIDDTVAAFLPPALPITTPHLTCTDALVEYARNGRWRFNVRVTAHGAAPVAFVAGFVTNLSGYFGGLIGAVNFTGGPPNTSSPASTAVAGIWSYSRWIEDDYARALADGVTIRVHSAADLQAPVRGLAADWRNAFERGLYRPLSLLDTDDDHRAAWGVPAMDGGSLLDEVGQDRGLSFEVSLRFM